MAQLLAPQTTAANSGDFTVVGGGSEAVFLANNVGGAIDGAAYVQVKDSAALYYDVFELSRLNPMVHLTVPGVYRVRKPITQNPVGVNNVVGQSPAVLADGAAVPTALKTGTVPQWYNGATLDFVRANQQVIELASGSRTTTQTGADRTNHNARGIHVSLDMTVVGTGSVTPKIQGKDANGIYYDLLVGAAITTNVMTVLKLAPGLAAVANAAANDLLPRTFRVVVTANNANAATYSLAYSLNV